MNLALIEHTFAVGSVITPEILLTQKLITRVGGKMPKVKILGTGKLTKKVSITGCLFSESAKAAIEAVGGSIK